MKLYLILNDECKYKDAQPLSFTFKKKGSAQVTSHAFKLSGSDVTNLPAALLFEKKNKSLVEWIVEVKESGTETNLPSWRYKEVIGGVKHFRLNPKAIEDIAIVCCYTVKT